MGMSRHTWLGLAVAAALSVSCTSSNSTKAGCKELYPAVKAQKFAVAGDLRFFGPRPSKGKGNFAELPDGSPITLCLVPDGKGSYAVYGIPKSTGSGQQLWTQNASQEFTPPL